MAESNPTQVILTDDGLKIIKAQNTADEAVGNVNDINSDNKLTPSEKLKLKQEYDKDVELYNIDIKQLKSVDLPTAKLETAMQSKPVRRHKNLGRKPKHPLNKRKQMPLKQKPTPLPLNKKPNLVLTN